jgi:hypothetical protein
MEARKAKRIAATKGAELVYNKDSKLWDLTIAGQSTEIGSADLKNMDPEVFESEIDGLVAVNEDPELVADADVEHMAPASGSKYPDYVIAAKYPKGGDAVTVVLPNGDEVQGLTSKKYFFFMDGDKAKGGAIEHVVDGKVDLR